MFEVTVLGIASLQVLMLATIVGALCLLALPRLLALISRGSEQRSPNDLLYRLRDDFLSDAELSFCRVLQSAVGERAVVCPKVNLADLFYVSAQDRSEKQSARNKIDRRHVDFVLCDPLTMRPICGVELDDASHQRAMQKETDQFKNRVFAAAGLPLVRIRAAKSYVVTDVAASVEPYLDLATPTKRRSQRATRDTETPICPTCGIEMVRRKAKRGANAGNSFWGCANYPKCRVVVET